MRPLLVLCLYDLPRAPRLCHLLLSSRRMYCITRATTRGLPVPTLGFTMGVLLCVDVFGLSLQRLRRSDVCGGAVAVPELRQSRGQRGRDDRR